MSSSLQQSFERTPVSGVDKGAAVAAALRRAARKSRQPSIVITGGGGFKARSGSNTFFRLVMASFFVVLFLPTLAATLYYGVIAAPQYGVEFKLAVRDNDEPINKQLLGLISDSEDENAITIRDYIVSRDMYEKIDKELNLRQVFRRPSADILARPSKDYSEEEMVKYWRRSVTVTVDHQASGLTILVRTFSPQDSLAIAERIVKYSEDLANDLTSKLRADAVRNASARLVRTESGLESATGALRQVQNDEGLLDANASAESVERLITALRMQLSDIDQRISVARSSGVTGDAPQLGVLNTRRETILKSLKVYQDSIADPAKGTRTLADKMAALEIAKTGLTVAQSQFSDAAGMFERARLEAESKKVYLIPVTRPLLPESAEYPRRFWSWSLICVPALCLWLAIFALMLMARDHMAV